MWDSLLAWLKERTASPLYGTYVVTIVLWNWQFFYTLFFQDQSALPVPKIEYVEAKFLGISWELHTLYFIILPVISTLVIIKFMPIITNWAYNVSIKFDFERKLSFDKAKLEYEREQNNILSERVTVKEEAVEAEKKIERITSEKDRWEGEYLEFKKNSIFYKFSKLLKAIYENGGNVRNNGAFNPEADILAVAHSRGLINLEGDYNDVANLTEKGKFFVEHYFNDGFPL